MNALAHIRKAIFRLSQKEFAASVGVNQSTVSRWEMDMDRSDRLAPSADEMARIRQLAIKLGHPWDDRWFFETPGAAKAAVRAGTRRKAGRAA